MRCKQCSKEYDVENAKRVYGGLPWTKEICSAFCYTESLDADTKKETPKKFQKITVGFVIQEYQTLDNGTHVCTEQEFMAGDQVDYEDMNGEPVEIDTLKEEYCPFNMVQPKRVPGLNPVKLAYADGVCPDCDTGIPEDVVDGQSCENCDHVFCLPKPDDG